MGNFVLDLFRCDCSCEALIRWMFWLLYTLSTVFVVIAMLIEGVPCCVAEPRTIEYAFINMHIFSAGLLGLYIYPWFMPGWTMFERLERATMNWLALSVFEEVFFQATHNMIHKYLHTIQGSGSFLEWPYFIYGFCDSRWNNYSDHNGLSWEIYTNNMMEGGSGLCILFVLFLEKYYWKISEMVATSEDKKQIVDHVKKQRKLYPHSLLFILTVLFRDAMLFRQTVSYFSDQHMEDYPFSCNYSKDEIDDWTSCRAQGVTGLWVINIFWIVAPCTTIIWCWLELTHRDMVQDKIKKFHKSRSIDIIAEDGAPLPPQLNRDISIALSIEADRSEEENRNIHKIGSKVLVSIIFMIMIVFLLFSHQVDPFGVLFDNLTNINILYLIAIQIISELYQSYGTGFVAIPQVQTLETNFGKSSMPYQIVTAMIFHQNQINFITHNLKILDCWWWYLVLKLNFGSNVFVLLLFSIAIIQAHTQTKNVFYLAMVVVYHGIPVLICLLCLDSKDVRSQEYIINGFKFDLNFALSAWIAFSAMCCFLTHALEPLPILVQDTILNFSISSHSRDRSDRRRRRDNRSDRSLPRSPRARSPRLRAAAPAAATESSNQLKGDPNLTIVGFIMAHKPYFFRTLLVLAVSSILGYGYELAAAFPLRLPNYFLYHFLTNWLFCEWKQFQKWTDVIAIQEAKRMADMDVYKNNGLDLYVYFYGNRKFKRKDQV